jgi:hypothetical protein
MRVFGRDMSKWWLIAIATLFLMACPALLMLFFMGNNLAGALFGPPAIWNRPWNSPQRSDLFGSYKETDRNLERTIESKQPASITLLADGSVIVSSLPSQSELTTCTLSAKGFWGGSYDGKINIRFLPDKTTSDGAVATCEKTSCWSLQLTGRSKPYGLYMSVGDPDSGTGIWFKRE